MERLLQAELEAHLEQEGAEAAKNSRNGYSDKTVQTESGPVPIRVPRDRNGTFEPALVKKHQRRVEGFDEKVLALYARGMTTRDIQAHLKDLYGTDVSHELISKATDAVLPEFRDWQSRALEAVYPVVYLDALFVSVRDGVQVQKRAFYVALGIRLDGRRDVLGIWAAETEGAKFWLSILNELRSRGVEDILFVCADGLSGLDKALETAFPKGGLPNLRRTSHSLCFALCELGRPEGGRSGPQAALRRRERTPSRARTRAPISQARREVSQRRSHLPQPLGAFRPVSCLSAGGPSYPLHHERHRIAQLSAQKVSQGPWTFS